MQDLRVKKTLKAIEDSFFQIRQTKDLDKIKVKELCEVACINKTTFYTYYSDIFELSDALEEALIEEKFKVIPKHSGLNFDIKTIVYNIFTAFDCIETQILFRDRYDVLMNKCEKKIFNDYKQIINSTEKQMFASFYIYGAFKILYSTEGPRQLKMDILTWIAESWLATAIK